MKKISLLFFLLTLTSTSFAHRWRDQVHSVEPGTQGEEHLVYLKSGRVLFIDPHYLSLEQLKAEQNIEVETDEQHQVKAMISVASEEERPSPSGDVDLSSQKASVLTSYQEANKIFRGMNRSWKKRTECTDRAHVWTYEEWRKHGLISQKVFLFFTNTYIRRYRFHWWFHVSPYTLVQEGNRLTEYAMDRRYSKSPLSMKNWTDLFVRSKRHCPVTSYRYYRSHKNSNEHCYAVKSTMYNRLPLHVRQQEDYGRSQNSFSRGEVNFSYRAFSRRGIR